MSALHGTITLALLAMTFGWGWLAGRRDTVRGPARLGCRQALRVIQSYVDGELDDATTHRLAAHLEDCRRCGLRATTYRAIKEALAHHEHPSWDSVARLQAFGERLSQAAGS